MLGLLLILLLVIVTILIHFWRHRSVKQKGSRMDFTQVETKFKELKEKYDAGTITEEMFKTQLEGLMIQDEEGRWWMIGYETSMWYFHDDEKWVQSEPPSGFAQKVTPRSVALAELKLQKFLGIVVLFVGLFVTFRIGFEVGSYVDHLSQSDAATWACASVVWLSGFICTILLTRKVWKRK